MSFYGIRYDRISDLVNIGAGQSCVVDVRMYDTCSCGASHIHKCEFTWVSYCMVCASERKMIHSLKLVDYRPYRRTCHTDNNILISTACICSLCIVRLTYLM